MSFMFPRVVSIGRLTETSNATDGYSRTATTLYTGVPASIQFKRDKGFGAPAGFPTGTNSDSPMPLIEIMLKVTSFSMVQPSDVITDELGIQYKVDWLEWTPLGAMAACSLYKPVS